jgi:hypothetical protein
MLYIGVALGITGYFLYVNFLYINRQLKVIKKLNFRLNLGQALTQLTKLLPHQVHVGVNTGTSLEKCLQEIDERLVKADEC